MGQLQTKTAVSDIENEAFILHLVWSASVVNAFLNSAVLPGKSF